MKRYILIGSVAVLSAVIYIFAELQHLQTSTVAPAAPTRQRSEAPRPASVHAASATSIRWSDRSTVALEGRSESAAGTAAAALPSSTGAPTGSDLRDHVEMAFRADPRVAASRDSERDLADSVRAVLPAGSTLREVECRSTMCRIETTHLDAGEFHDFMKRGFLAHDAPLATRPVLAGMPAEPRPGQPVLAVAYVGRDGAAMATAIAAAASPASPDRP